MLEHLELWLTRQKDINNENFAQAESNILIFLSQNKATLEISNILYKNCGDKVDLDPSIHTNYEKYHFFMKNFQKYSSLQKDTLDDLMSITTSYFNNSDYSREKLAEVVNNWNGTSNFNVTIDQKAKLLVFLNNNKVLAQQCISFTENNKNLFDAFMIKVINQSNN